MKERCKCCGKKLTSDDIGISMKLIDRKGVECLCTACVADFFRCDISVIQAKIAQFKANGCTLFVLH